MHQSSHLLLAFCVVCGCLWMQLDAVFASNWLIFVSTLCRQKLLQKLPRESQLNQCRGAVSRGGAKLGSEHVLSWAVERDPSGVGANQWV